MAQTARTEATRTALGPTLARLCREGLDIVCVDADLGYSTSAVKFGQEFPERFFPVGVAEQNMIGVSAGLAACGKIAFCSSFAVFAPGHCFDQLRMAVGQPRTNVKLVASHGGVVTGEDGASAEALEDLALMRSIPTFSVVYPADVVEAEQAIEMRPPAGRFVGRNSEPGVVRVERLARIDRRIRHRELLHAAAVMRWLRGWGILTKALVSHPAAAI